MGLDPLEREKPELDSLDVLCVSEAILVSTEEILGDMFRAPPLSDPTDCISEEILVWAAKRLSDLFQAVVLSADGIARDLVQTMMGVSAAGIPAEAEETPAEETPAEDIHFGQL